MDKLSIENEKKLVSSIELIGKIVSVGRNALDKFPTGDYSIFTFTFINFLERFTYNLEAIKILLKEYKTNPHLETSIGLTIRASLLDFIIMTYLFSYQADILSDDDKENEEKFNKQFDSFITDQVHFTFKHLKVVKDVGQISEAEYKTAIENTCHTYSFLFKQKDIDYNNPGKHFISNERKSVKDYYVRIHNHPMSKQYSGVYDLYTYYSKYEHFGIMTHFMQRQGVNYDFDSMIESFKYMTTGMSMCFLILSHPTDNIQNEKTELNKLRAEFELL